MPPAMTPRALLETLVGFPTVSRDSNLSLIDLPLGGVFLVGGVARAMGSASPPRNSTPR